VNSTAKVARARPIDSIPMVLAAAGVLSTAADAGEIIMHNGDRLTGEVVRQEEDRPSLETSYAGVLEIDWSQVREVRLDQPTPVLLDGERVLEVAAVSRTGSQVTLRRPPPAPPVRVEAERVKTIALGPWELGQGYALGGRSNVAVQSEKGNSENDELDLDFELSYRRRDHLLESFGQLEYDANDGDRTAQNWILLNKYSHFFDGPWYASAWLRLKHDRFADLRFRYLAGPSLGYRFFEGEGLNLSAELGAIYLSEDFHDNPKRDNWGPSLFLVCGSWLT
jgi:hypothetical protein